MKRIRASTFKARFSAVIKSVQTTGQPILVTRDGKPIVKIVPIVPEGDDLFGCMAGEFRIAGDIEGPTGTWKTAKRNPHRAVAPRLK